jgi:hypothetical protein
MSNDSAGLKLRLWTERMRRFEQSNQTVADFCRSEHVSQSSFYLWKGRVAEACVGEVPLARDNGTAESAPRFQSVVVTSPSAAGVTIRLPDGVAIELGEDAALIEQVVNQLLNHQSPALGTGRC